MVGLERLAVGGPAHVTTLALALVLASAVIHATWNLLAKRVEGGSAFLWLVYAVSAVAYAPLALVVTLAVRPAIGAAQLVFIVGTIALHLAYFTFLTRGYRAGDLSLVYPVARASGPLIATIGAVVLFAERPTPLALAGAGLIIGGALILTGDPRALQRTRATRALVYALLTGATIGLYTLWDKQAVSTFALPPLLYDWARNLGLALVAAPVALRQRASMLGHWSVRRREVVAVALLSPLAYILVLTALSVSPVSYVAPLRESGILIGTLMGTHLLAEGHARRRLAAAGGMALGILALSLG